MAVIDNPTQDAIGSTASDQAMEDLLARLDDDGRLVHIERLPTQPARIAMPRHPIATGVWDKLGLGSLYSHQARAIDLIREGESVVIATGTASGKSLCYQVPIAEAVGRQDHPATALALFPTKALAHDQLRALGQYNFDGMVASTYDGDTDPEYRVWVRHHANTILTNPEMLHLSLLPNHARWGAFFRRLELVVIDELHVLRGVFGTHMAHVLRRLRRVAEHYGADPTFVFASATIGEPGRLARELCGKPVTAITEDGAPKGPRTFALLNPPLLDEQTGVRSSTTSETSSLITELVHAGRRTIAFTASRKGTELVAGDVKRRLGAGNDDRVRSYRAGYLASERREIEEELVTGKVSAVVATSALELGIDIGGLDACVMSGFPGTIASLWQQAGRAGRTGQLAISVLVAGDDQLDQWFMAHPREVFDRPPEPAVINPSNPFVADPHLSCAAYELPITVDDSRFWPHTIDEGIRRLVHDGQLITRRRGGEPLAVWAGAGTPARGVGLRSGSSHEVRIELANGTLVGTVDNERAPNLVHAGAVYLHRGQSFRVTKLDLDARRATVIPDDGSEYTQPKSTTDINVLTAEQTRTVGPSTLTLGRVEVIDQVIGYQRKERRTLKILGNYQLDLPPQRLVTRAFWYTVDHVVLEAAELCLSDLPGTLHAAEHGAIGMLPLFTICDRWDVGGVSTAFHADTQAPTIFIYDGYPGGTGIAELGFGVADSHLSATLDLIRACPCSEGCPSCVVSPKCGNGNEPLDKHGAIRLLDAIVHPNISPKPLRRT